MKHYEKRRSVSSKMFVMMLALVLVFGCAVGGTIAWLTAKTTPVVNTFTYGDIKIDLTESGDRSFKIIPGVDITKDPKVTVEATSEPCYLFVKVEEENWPTFTETDATTGKTKNKVSYEIADGWTALEGQNGVYYRIINTVTTANTDYPVLKDNKVTVSENLSKAEINGIAADKKIPKLTFTAYAIQKEGFATPEAAWTEVSK